jgi:transcription elongation factor Elf1
MPQTKFYCSNCKRWEATEITRQVAHHERRAFRCDFCGHAFLENQSVAEYEAAVASEDDLEAPDDLPSLSPNPEEKAAMSPEKPECLWWCPFCRSKRTVYSGTKVLMGMKFKVWHCNSCGRGFEK